MNILHKIKCKIYRFLLKNGMLAPKVVLLMDGGVCSQIISICWDIFLDKKDIGWNMT